MGSRTSDGSGFRVVQFQVFALGTQNQESGFMAVLHDLAWQPQERNALKGTLAGDRLTPPGPTTSLQTPPEGAVYIGFLKPYKADL